MTRPTNPLDALFRNYLMEHTDNQGALAHAIGRDRTWLNRYLNGTGVASVDDVILLLAAVIHAESDRVGEALTETEQRLVRAFRALPDDALRSDVIVSMEAVRKARQQPRAATEPNSPAPPVVVPRSPRTRRPDDATPSPVAERRTAG